MMRLPNTVTKPLFVATNQSIVKFFNTLNMFKALFTYRYIHAVLEQYSTYRAGTKQLRAVVNKAVCVYKKRFYFTVKKTTVDVTQC
jgi:hypothetical protein